MNALKKNTGSSWDLVLPSERTSEVDDHVAVFKAAGQFYAQASRPARKTSPAVHVEL